MELFFREKGQGDKTIIILHGLYGSSDNWMSVAGELEDQYRVILVDQRNHGRSPHSDLHTYEAMAKDLHSLMEKPGIDKAILIGHSMGGKTIMRFSMMYPEMVEKLIVVDIAPKSYRSFSNYAEITVNHKKIIDESMAVDPSKFTSRHEIDQTLKEVFPDRRLRAFLMKNLKRKKEGGYAWQINFEALKNNLEEIMDGFSELNKPDHKMPQTVFIKGEKSPYIQDDDTLVISKFFPGSQVVTIPDAGHWVHAEKQDIFVKTVKYFLDS